MSDFEDDQCQVVIPKHLNFMVSYAHKSHHLKVVKGSTVINIEDDSYDDPKLFQKFQTPIIRIFDNDSRMMN